MGYVETANFKLKKPTAGTVNSTADPYIEEAFDLIDLIITRVVIHNGEIVTSNGAIVTTGY